MGFLIGIIIIFFLYKIYNKIPTGEYYEIKLVMIPIVFIIFFVMYVIPIGSIRVILAFFGKHSMNIYLVHDFLGRFA